MKVIKRDGIVTDLDINKIRLVINKLLFGLPDYISTAEIESNLNIKLRDGITTTEIQENLIQTVLELTSIDKPYYTYLAGRLHFYDYNKQVLTNRGYLYKFEGLSQGQTFYRSVMALCKNNQYKEEILQYSKDELIQAGEWIVSDRDYLYDYQGAYLLTKKYLVKNELLQEAFLVNALLLASVESDSDKMTVAKSIYDAISGQKISLATPMMSNLRIKGGNVASCFIISVDDSIESIFNNVANSAHISSHGGGVGINLSRIRSEGSTIRGNTNTSNGVVPWCTIFNQTANAVNQAGKRSGAFTLALDTWHLDIEKFIEMRLNHGDLRMKALDIFTQVVCSDLYMSRVKSGAEWTLFDPYEIKTKFNIELTELYGTEFEDKYKYLESEVTKGNIKLYKKVNAKELFKFIQKSCVETGLPYVFFKDRANRANPNKSYGVIPNGNLCMESYSVTVPDQLAHSCNLSSLNLANIKDHELEYYSRLCVRIIDNAIDLTNPPIPEASKHNDLFRTIGVGIMGLADYMALNKYTYATNVKEVTALVEDIAYYITDESANLAVHRGSFEAFPESEWAKGLLVNCMTLEQAQNLSYSPDRWLDLQSKILSTGLRNSHLFMIAPNTSTSAIQGCSPSVLPIYKKFYYYKVGKLLVPVVAKYIDTHYWYYDENFRLEQNYVVDMVASIQNWVDTGISMELLFNMNEDIYAEGKSLSAKDLYNTYIRAWESGCKTIYYMRTIQKDESKKLTECSSCAN